MEKLQKVLITEKIADEGIALLEKELEVHNRDGISREELLEIIDQYDALIVRSVTKVNEELIKRASRLKVVGRAGNGIDNIDVEVCTRYGVIVANTPDSNTISAAEQTLQGISIITAHQLVNIAEFMAYAVFSSIKPVN
jgi:D-3-phosphoglycerate dehydrogenase